MGGGVSACVVIGDRIACRAEQSICIRKLSLQCVYVSSEIYPFDFDILSRCMLVKANFKSQIMSCFSCLFEFCSQIPTEKTYIPLFSHIRVYVNNVRRHM